VKSATLTIFLVHLELLMLPLETGKSNTVRNKEKGEKRFWLVQNVLESG
jgi:hypothetical protein